MDRIVRCQGAVIQNDQILIVKHMNLRLNCVYWWLPGGGPEEGETFEECAKREILEETHLEVRIERLLLDTLDPTRTFIYERYLTYLCAPLSSEMIAGSESGSQTHAIIGLGWYPLWDESQWEEGFYELHMGPLMKAIQEKLNEA